MKIKVPQRDEILTVYGIYWSKQARKRAWSNNDDNLEIVSMACCIPSQYKGIIVYDLSEVEVVDATIDKNFIYYKSKTKGMTGVFHRALVEEELFDDLTDDYGGKAYLRFMEILNVE
jgi:hypothetical protein